MSKAEIVSLLALPLNASLSTLGHDGSPHAAGMWFVVAGEELRMWAYAKSQKVVNLSRDRRCAFLVEDGLDYFELRGILVRGRAKLVTHPSAVAAIGRALYDKYTFPRTGVAADEGPIAEVERQAAKRVGITLALDNVASWDHGKLPAAQT